MSPEPVILIVQSEDPCNTLILDSESGDIVYTVFTVLEGKKTVTYVKDAKRKTIASWEWQSVRSDTLVLGSGSKAQRIPVGMWLQQSIIPFNRYVLFWAAEVCANLRVLITYWL